MLKMNQTHKEFSSLFFTVKSNSSKLPTGKAHNHKMKTIEIQLVEVSAGIKTRTGNATLYKGWSESEKTMLSVWSDDKKPNPFLKGKGIADFVRVVEEVREESDLNGNKVTKTFHTVIPSAPQS